jgi:arylsulfatase A-like enzyme
VHPGELAGASQADLEHFRALYRERIAAIDALFPELVRRVEAELGPDTLWVVTADHGEGFDAATGRVHHGGRLHDDLLRVPLFVRGPGLAPRVVDEPVRHLDVGPTLLELCGLAPLPGAAGVSLLPCLAGEVPFPELAFAEERAHGYGLVSVRSARWKRIQAPDHAETYDLGADPGELRPADGPRELEQALAEFPTRYPARALSEVELDDATEEQLRALGYVQ